jgi:hypothetical protein
VVPVAAAGETDGRDRRPGRQLAAARPGTPASAPGVGPVVQRRWPVVLPDALLASGTARQMMQEVGAGVGASDGRVDPEVGHANPAAAARSASDAYRRNGAAPGLYPTLPRIFRVSV